MKILARILKPALKLSRVKNLPYSRLKRFRPNKINPATNNAILRSFDNLLFDFIFIIRIVQPTSMY